MSAYMPDVDATFDRFEALLSRCNVSISKGSRLESVLLFAKKCMYISVGADSPGAADDRAMWREVVGVYDLSRKLIWAEKRSRHKFQSLTPHLKLLASTAGQFAQTAPPADKTPGGAYQPDQAADKLFELFVALCLFDEIGQIETDPGDGTNPDLIFRYQHRWWGVACKRIYGVNPVTYRDRVSKGVDQIEKSKAERGVVFVSLSNIVNHDLFLPATSGGYGAMTASTMLDVLESEQTRIAGATIACTDNELSQVFDDRKASRGVVHYIGSTYFRGEGPDSDHTVCSIQRAWSRGRVGDFCAIFQRGLNRVA